jgi:hypothetical protein
VEKNGKKLEKWKKVKMGKRDKGEKRKRDKEFKLINVVVFGKYKKIVQECCSFQKSALVCILCQRVKRALRARGGMPSAGARI